MMLKVKGSMCRPQVLYLAPKLNKSFKMCELCQYQHLTLKGGVHGVCVLRLIIYLCVYVWRQACHSACVETREQLAQLVLLLHVGPTYLTQAVRFSSKSLYLTNHLSGAIFVSETFLLYSPRCPEAHDAPASVS